MPNVVLRVPKHTGKEDPTTFFNDIVADMADLQTMWINYRGAYDPAATYEVGDAVITADGTFRAKQQTTGNAPTPGGDANWDLLAPPGTDVDHISRTSGTGAPGTTDTYTMWADAAETISLGTFTVYNGTQVDHVSRTSGTGAPGTTDIYTMWGDAAETINLGTFAVYQGANGAGDMSTPTYDPAGIAEQVVGLTAAQTLTNKTLTAPHITAPTGITPADVGAEPALGNPPVDGMVLASTAAGARSWVSIADIDRNRRNIAVNAFRIAVNGNLSVRGMVDGFVDEFVDETGIDTPNSTGQIYDASGDFYINMPVSSSLIPTMTSNTAPSGTASASSINSTSFDAFKAMDKNPGATYWYAANTGVQWLEYDFGSPRRVTAYKMYLVYSSNAPYTWTFEGSNDGVNWVTLDSRTQSVGLNIWNTFQISPATYSRFRIVVSATAGGAPVVINEFDLEGYDAPQAMTLTSAPQNALAQPSVVRPVLLAEVGGTLNADLTMDVSRDGGTTWTAVPLAVDGNYDTSISILSGSADVSAQPAGTSIVYRINATSAAGQTIHGVSLSWK